MHFFLSEQCYNFSEKKCFMKSYWLQRLYSKLFYFNQISQNKFLREILHLLNTVTLITMSVVINYMVIYNDNQDKNDGFVCNLAIINSSKIFTRNFY